MMKHTRLITLLGVATLFAPSLRGESLWQEIKHAFGQKPGAETTSPTFGPGAYAPRHRASPDFRERLASQSERRIEHWETTIKALKAYGVSEDSETMRWAHGNLQRAHHPRVWSTRHHKPVRRTRVVEAERPSHRRAYAKAKHTSYRSPSSKRAKKQNERKKEYNTKRTAKKMA